jgi:hypothetical protein
MQRVSLGYTIVEVIIFLAVSAMLLIISSLFLQGSDAHNRFSQSMKDMQSKVQDWINDVPTGFVGGQDYSGINCQVTGTKGTSSAQLVIKNNPGGGNKGECIFLGKVIQFTDYSGAATTPDQDKRVYAYSVFGQRTWQPPPPEDERLVANLVEAVPVAADNQSGNTDLTDTYFIKGGARVKNIKASSGVADSHLAGFFLTFNQPFKPTNGSTDLKAYQYPVSGNLYPGNDPANGQDASGCISLKNNGTVTCAPPSPSDWDNWPRPMTDWQICFDNPSNKDTAILTITSDNGLGITTKLDFTDC